MFRRSSPTGVQRYVAVDSGLSRDEVFAATNSGVFFNYGPDLRHGPPKRRVAAPHGSFVRLLEALVAIDHLRFIDHIELSAVPCPPDVVRIAFRHDIDSDIVAAVEQAQAEADHGIRANWVVLHTAPYYGWVDNDSKFTGTKFRRNNAMAGTYQQLQELGHEVSIHADPLGLYQHHGLDGAEGFTTELAWLRSLGLDIRGTTAHNNRLSYGAENYEIFTGFVAPRSTAQPADATGVDHNGRHSPLRILDEVELGLEYEGNQVFWDDPRRVEMGSVHADDRWYWSDRRRRFYNTNEIDRAQLLHEIKALPRGSDVVLVVHPEYFGARVTERSGPRITLDPPVAVERDGFARTWEPFTTVGVDTDSAILVANAWGMFDVPVPDERADDALRVLCIGADNLDAASIPLAAQVTRRLETLLGEMHGRAVQVTKMAHPGASGSDCLTWFRYGVAELDPDIVVVGVSTSPSPADVAAIDEVLQACADDGRDVALVTEQIASTGPDFRADWQTRAARVGALLIDLGPALRHERDALGLEATDLWSPTDHRIASVRIASAISLLLRQRTGADGQHEQEALLASAETALRRPPEPNIEADQSTGSADAAAAIGLADWPTPFTAGLAFADDYQAPTVDSVRAQLSHLVVGWGLDHGVGVPLADHHQRYSGGRRGMSTPNAALLTHDLRRDNAPLAGASSWLAQTLKWFHRGDLDHLAGLSAWGMRSLALGIVGQSSGVSRLTSAAGTADSATVPYMFNADHLPIGTVVIETTSGIAPESIAVSGGTFVATGDSGGHAQVVATVDELVLAEVRPLLGATQLLFYEPRSPGLPLGVNTGLDPVSQRSALTHAALDGFDVSIDSLDIVGAGLHNLSIGAVGDALDRLAQDFGFHASMVVAPRHHGFYTAVGLVTAAQRLQRARHRQPDNAPTAAFGDAGGPAHVSIVDSPTSAAFAVDVLRKHGLVAVAANGGLQETAERAEDEAGIWPAPSPSDVVASGTDRSGEPVIYVQPVEPWRNDGAELAAAHNGWNPDAPDSRQWFTRPSVIAAYATAHRHVADHGSRAGDEITIPSADQPVVVDHPDQLFGLSFAVDDVTRASVHLESKPVTELIRWPGHGAVTVGTCGIRWPIIGEDDPVAIADDRGDLARAEVAGSWTWTPGAAAHGTLHVDPAGTGRLTLDFDQLDVTAAQVLHVRLQALGEPEQISVRLFTHGGAILEASTGAAEPDAHGTAAARWQLPEPAAGWEDHTIPLWGLDWTGVPAAELGITRVDVTCAGPPDSGVRIADLWLGRPRQLPTAHQPAPQLGGNALGRERVDGRHLRSEATFSVAVDSDGLWHSGPLPTGAWVVRADTAEAVTVALSTPRFDLDLGVDEANR